MSPDRPGYKWWIALTVVPAGLIQAVDATSVSVAIPNMMTSLRADLNQIQWVVTISLVLQTLLMPTSGWLTSLIGRRRLFVGRGYNIRKLNQAWFAFHGSYATGAGSVSPIGEQLRDLRSSSGSVGEFLKTMAQFGSYEEYLEYWEGLDGEGANTEGRATTD